MGFPHLVFFGLFITINGLLGIFLIWRSIDEHILQPFLARRAAIFEDQRFEAGEAPLAARATE